MSKVKSLINEVFKQGELDSSKNKKNGIALFLSVHLKESFKLSIDERTLVRYYDAYVLEIKEEISIEPYKLDKLSQYVGYENFKNFSNTIIKKGEDANLTEVKVNVDGNETTNSKKSTDVSIIINNIIKSNFPDAKDFITKNGAGILEMTFIILLVTGGVVLSNNKKSTPIGFLSAWQTPMIEKKYMYWDEDRYMATDSSYLGPQIEVMPMEKNVFVYQKKITRPDTLSVENAMGKVWYNKSNNQIEFFTSFGKHPENEKTLKDVTPYILYNYAGINAELARN